MQARETLWHTEKKTEKQTQTDANGQCANKRPLPPSRQVRHVPQRLAIPHDNLSGSSKHRGHTPELKHTRHTPTASQKKHRSRKHRKRAADEVCTHGGDDARALRHSSSRIKNGNGRHEEDTGEEMYECLVQENTAILSIAAEALR